MCLCLVDSYKLRRPLACFLGLPRTLPLITSVLSVWIVKISNFPVCEIFGNQVLGTFYVSTCCSASCSAGASTTNCGWSLCSRGRIGCQCASLISSEAEAGPNVGARRAPLSWNWRLSFLGPRWGSRFRGTAWGRVAWWITRSGEDSKVLKASLSSSLSLSSFRTFLLGLRRLGPDRVSSPSSS